MFKNKINLVASMFLFLLISCQKVSVANQSNLASINIGELSGVEYSRVVLELQNVDDSSKSFRTRFSNGEAIDKSVYVGTYRVILSYYSGDDEREVLYSTNICSRQAPEKTLSAGANKLQVTVYRNDCDGEIVTEPVSDKADVSIDPSLGGAVSASSIETSRSSGSNCFKQTTDFYKEKGPYEVEEKAASGRTFFYPKNPKKGCKYLAVGWGNGMAMTGSRPYAALNKHLASWGMYVCADHSQGAASGKDATSCLDAINEKEEFKPYLSGKMATAGHSMGGGGAVNGASRDGVSTFVSVQTCAPAGGEGLKKAGLYLTGTADWFNCKSMTGSTYKSHKGKGFYAVYKGAGHTDTPMGRGAGVDAYRGISAAWLHCWGTGISSACRLFEGEENAPIKNQGSWVELKSKNI